MPHRSVSEVKVYEFPRDGGQMGRAIREFDWSGTTLGPPHAWPQALRAVVQMSLSQKHAICLFWGPELTMIYNDAYAPMLGDRQSWALGRPFAEVWSDVWPQVKPIADQALAGDGTFHENMHLVMTRKGYEEDTYWTFSYSPLYDDEGHVRGLIDVAVDTTPMVLSQREAQVLQRELVHRVKNSLAVTSAIVTASMRNAASVDEARTTIMDRIKALGDAQNLMTQGAGRVEVRQIVAEAMRAQLDDVARADIEGPRVALESQQAVGLSLAVYELATNAMKYGALSNAQGRIEVRWELGTDRAFRFSWQERGGPPVHPPQRTGFGSRLTSRVVASYFGGTGETHYDPDGIRFELSGHVAEGQ
jgi:two-component sensor histidine kinase